MWGGEAHLLNGAFLARRGWLAEAGSWMIWGASGEKALRRSSITASPFRPDSAEVRGAQASGSGNDSTISLRKGGREETWGSATLVPIQASLCLSFPTPKIATVTAPACEVALRIKQVNAQEALGAGPSASVRAGDGSQREESAGGKESPRASQAACPCLAPGHHHWPGNGTLGKSLSAVRFGFSIGKMGVLHTSQPQWGA